MSVSVGKKMRELYKLGKLTAPKQNATYLKELSIK